MAIRLKRAYEEAAESDGLRVLVDRLWPRGVSKEAAAIDVWLKAAAPSTELRKWFNHDEPRWEEFTGLYQAELGAGGEELEQAIAPVLKRAKRGRVTLVYGARDETRNHAVVLKAYLDERA